MNLEKINKSVTVYAKGVPRRGVIWISVRGRRYAYVTFYLIADAKTSGEPFPDARGAEIREDITETGETTDAESQQNHGGLQNAVRRDSL